jgi:hypothetical protein
MPCSPESPPATCRRSRGRRDVVAGVGKPAFVQGDWIKPGAIVLDVVIDHPAEGKLVDDVDFNAARERASWIMPVPGSVGPMIEAMLVSKRCGAAELADPKRPCFRAASLRPIMRLSSMSHARLGFARASFCVVANSHRRTHRFAWRAQYDVVKFTERKLRTL